MLKTLLNSYTAGFALTLLATTSLNTDVRAQQKIITTVVGTGALGYSGDGGAAKAARLQFPVSVVKDAAGKMFIADYDAAVIRKVNTDGIISTVAGNGTGGYSGDGGPATAAQMNGITAVAVDNAGNIYISDRGNNVVRKVDAAGIITTVAGTSIAGYSGDGGPATAAMLGNPAGIAVDGSGNLFIADEYNAIIRKVSAGGIITTFAGIPDSVGHTGDGGPATAAKLNGVFAICTDHAGNLYLSEFGSPSTIRKIDASGTISLVAGSDSGPAYAGGSVPATSVQIPASNGLAVDDSGNIYASVTSIIKINSAGILSTFAGNGHGGFGGDGGDPLFATLDPYGICVDNAGDLYISGSSRIRRISAKPLGISPVRPDAPVVVAFPNPCRDQLSISGLIGDGRISLMNLSGQTLMEQTFSHAGQLPVCLMLPSEIAAGTYMLQAITNDTAVTLVITIEK